MVGWNGWSGWNGWRLRQTAFHDDLTYMIVDQMGNMGYAPSVCLQQLLSSPLPIFSSSSIFCYYCSFCVFRRCREDTCQNQIPGL